MYMSHPNPIGAHSRSPLAGFLCIGPVPPLNQYIQAGNPACAVQACRATHLQKASVNDVKHPSRSIHRSKRPHLDMHPWSLWWLRFDDNRKKLSALATCQWTRNTRSLPRWVPLESFNDTSTAKEVGQYPKPRPLHTRGPPVHRLSWLPHSLEQVYTNPSWILSSINPSTS
jgi:hypothetical protein